MHTELVVQFGLALSIGTVVDPMAMGAEGL